MVLRTCMEQIELYLSIWENFLILLQFLRQLFTHIMLRDVSFLSSLSFREDKILLISFDVVDLVNLQSTIIPFSLRTIEMFLNSIANLRNNKSFPNLFFIMSDASDIKGIPVSRLSIKSLQLLSWLGEVGWGSSW